MPTDEFKPGDRVVWGKQTPGGGYVIPVLSTVLAVTAKRVKIEAEDEDGIVIRHVLPKSLVHHSPSTKLEKSAPKKPSAGRSKPSEPLIVRPDRKSTPKKDEVREERIIMEIVVDAYDEVERAMGWYCYLQDNLSVPFRARCVEEREVSPLSKGDEVEVVDLSPESESEREMFVSIRWGKRTLAVPLSQLQPIKADKATSEAVEDWHYWVEMGYSF